MFSQILPRTSARRHKAVLYAIAAFFVCVSAAAQLNPTPPATPVRLVFIHHSVGWSWLNPEEGTLLTALRSNNYYVSDTDYDWGPYDEDADDGANIGSHTDIGQWYNWFLGPHRDLYLSSLYANSMLSADWRDSETVADPGGENTVVIFKSCFVSARNILGEATDEPTAAGVPNPLRGRSVSEEDGSMYSVSNIKGLYRELLGYFAQHPEKLFVIITTPPSHEGEADEAMPKLRAVNTWLVEHLLDGYALNNVFVFDYSNVLTSNGGDNNTNDIGATTGGHHRFAGGMVEYRLGQSHFLAYATWDEYSSTWDDHPTAAGHLKATAEFLPLLNIAYNQWKGSTSVSPSVSRDLDAPRIDACHPAPVSAGAHIDITVPESGNIRLEAYSTSGKRCEVLFDGDLRVGKSTVFWDTANLPAGAYLLRLSGGGRTAASYVALVRH